MLKGVERRFKIMRLNFKKVSAIAASVLMTGMTMGVAAAANYPNPFVVSGNANVAVVYGTGAGVSSLDLVQAGNIQGNLQSYMTGSSTTDASVSGEAVDLASGGTKIYINDSLNAVKGVLTKSSLPTVLADGSFSGNVEATFSQKIDLGSNPKVTFAKQPTSSDDPNLALTLSTTQTNYIYNDTVTFSKAINFTHADSEGENLDIFGSSFTVSSATDSTSLVLLKSAEKVDLSSDSATAQVTIAGAAYTIELVSASDTTATVKVTDSAGDSESKEVTEAQSKKINGLTVAVTSADENNLKYSASVVAGSEKITLTDASSVQIGEESTSVDGTLVDFGTGNPNNLTTLTISVYGADSDMDAVKPGESFADPVYGTFKLDLTGYNIDSVVGSTSSSRETISFSSSSDDKEYIKFTDHRGYEKSFQFVKNQTTGVMLQGTDDGKNITVLEGKRFHKGEFVVVGNEDEGYLLELKEAKNSSAGVTGDVVRFEDVFSGTSYTATLADDGTGTVDVGGKTYSVTLTGIGGLAGEVYNVSLGYPDSTGAGVVILFPTIETSKGAKVALTAPETITLTQLNVDAYVTGATGSNLTEIKLPDGDGYTSVDTFTKAVAGNYTFKVGATTYELNVSDVAAKAVADTSVVVPIGQLTYNFSTTGVANQTKISLINVGGTAEITSPSVVIFEEKDDNAAYQALIVEIDDGGDSNDGIGVDTVEDTWSNAASGWTSTRYSDSKQADRMDLFGSIINVDSSDSDQKIATISYPNEQIYAQLYMGEEAATITAGTSTGATQLGDILVKDSEVSSVSSKNLVVVGGSCINSVAANLLGGVACGADFTTKTGVGTGQFLIQSLVSPYSTGNIALVVAGYEAADTVNAAMYLRTQTVDTAAGKKYKGTSATVATLETTSE
jgi:hypothetical protein